MKIGLGERETGGGDFEDGDRIGGERDGIRRMKIGLRERAGVEIETRSGG
ncbi:MAG: hypothetical protein AAGA10_06265 [Bacteroidota bacterium]